jgi:hypothetical protein
MNSDEFIIQGVRKEKVMILFREINWMLFWEIDNQGYKALCYSNRNRIETYKNSE